MSALPKRDYITLEEYYGLAKNSDRRWEYWDGEIVCMSGTGDKNHVRIQTNLIQVFANNLKGSCEAFGPDMTVKAKLNKSGLVFPDMSISCDGLSEKHSSLGFDMLINPIVVCEVVSKESVFRDFHLKLKAYQAIESVQDYLIINTSDMQMTHYTRQNGQWVGYVYNDFSNTIVLKSVGVTFTVAEIYKRVIFEVE